MCVVVVACVCVCVCVCVFKYQLFRVWFFPPRLWMFDIYICKFFSYKNGLDWPSVPLLLVWNNLSLLVSGFSPRHGWLVCTFITISNLRLGDTGCLSGIACIVQC